MPSFYVENLIEFLLTSLLKCTLPYFDFSTRERPETNVTTLQQEDFRCGDDGDCDVFGHFELDG